MRYVPNGSIVEQVTDKNGFNGLICTTRYVPNGSIVEQRGARLSDRVTGTYPMQALTR
jgi:hypothetical protein